MRSIVLLSAIVMLASPAHAEPSPFPYDFSLGDRVVANEREERHEYEDLQQRREDQEAQRIAAEDERMALGQLNDTIAQQDNNPYARFKH